MLKTLYICDQCGAEKKETNHWFTMREFLFDPVHPSCPAERARAELRVRFFADGTIAGDQHICGQACLVQAISEFASRSGTAKEAVA